MALPVDPTIAHDLARAIDVDCFSQNGDLLEGIERINQCTEKTHAVALRPQEGAVVDVKRITKITAHHLPEVVNALGFALLPSAEDLHRAVGVPQDRAPFEDLPTAPSVCAPGTDKTGADYLPVVIYSIGVTINTPQV